MQTRTAKPQIGERAVGHLAAFSLPLAVLIAVTMNALDMYGTFAWVRDQVGSTDALLPGVFVFILTTGIQYGLSAVAYAGGSIVYIAGIGVWLNLFQKITGHEHEGGLIDNLSTHFEHVQATSGGMAYLLLFFWPSVFFDMYTDYAHASTEPWALSLSSSG